MLTTRCRIYAYAFGWSFGHSVAPYVVAAEIFPARIRSVCMAVCLFTNWIVNYGITSATPHMITHVSLVPSPFPSFVGLESTPRGKEKETDA